MCYIISVEQKISNMYSILHTADIGWSYHVCGNHLCNTHISCDDRSMYRMYRLHWLGNSLFPTFYSLSSIFTWCQFKKIAAFVEFTIIFLPRANVTSFSGSNVERVWEWQSTHKIRWLGSVGHAGQDKMMRNFWCCDDQMKMRII